MPLPEKREDETDFERRIRHHMEHVEEHPGGREQAIAIAAREAGVSKEKNLNEFLGLISSISKSSQREAIDILRKALGGGGGRFGSIGGRGVGTSGGTGVSGRGILSSPRTAFGTGYSFGTAAAYQPAGATAGLAARTVASALPGRTKPSTKPAAGKPATTKPATSTAPTTPMAPTAPKPPKAPSAPKAPSVPKSISAKEEAEEETCPHGMDVKACKACKGEVEKALTSRSLVIPFHLRGPAYDPNAIERSATQQTSHMYTALAPAVEDTLNTIRMQEPAKTTIPVTWKSCAAHGLMYKSDSFCPICTEASRIPNEPRAGLYTHLR